MAGRGYRGECAYARLRRYDDLNEQWVDQFNQDLLIEVSYNGQRVFLTCRGYNSQLVFQSPIDDANIVRTSNEVFKISSQRMAVQLFFRSASDVDIFQRQLTMERLQFRDERPLMMLPNQGQFDGGGPFQPYGQQQYNRQSQPIGNQPYGGYGRQGNQGQYDQRYPQQYDSQDQRWGQPQPITNNEKQRWDQPHMVGGQDQNRNQHQPHMAGDQDQNWNRHPMTSGQDQGWNQPMDRRNNQQAMYQNIPGSGPQYQGGDQYGQRRQQFDGASYDGGGAQPRKNQDDMYNQRQGMNQGQHGGMQPGPQQGYQRGGPPARGVQDVSYGAKEAWSEREPFTINSATKDLAIAINNCDYKQACDIIDQLEKLEKSKRLFNIQLEHFGEIIQYEEETVKEEDNEFRLKVSIERQCAPNENSIDIIIKAKEEDTIDHLVNLFETQYNIPGEVQRWIIQQQLASDRSKCSLKDFQVTKNGDIDQGVYLFVIQGMKEGIKEEFLNKRQQQVEDDQRQQQQMAEKENIRKQTQIASNTPDQFGSVMPYDHNVPPQHQQLFNAQNQGSYMDRASQGPPPNQRPPQNMGPGFYQDQGPMQPVEQPLYRAQPRPPPQQQYPQQQYHQPEQQHVPRYDVGNRGSQRDEYRPKPLDRYMEDPGPLRDDFRQKQPTHQAEVQPPPVAMRQNNPPRGAAGGVQVFPIQKQANEQPLPLNTMPPQRTQVNEQPPPKSFAIGEPEKPRGWNCPVCTFLNEPYRPGCKMCSSAPPEGYEPPADHVPSAEEMKFMQ